jgi:hypothetical protein
MNKPNHIEDMQISVEMQKWISTIRLFIGISLSINSFVVLLGFRTAYGIGSILGFSGSMLIKLWPYYLMILGLAILLALSQRLYYQSFARIAKSVFDGLSAIGVINAILFGMPIVLYGAYRLVGWDLPFIENIHPVWIFGHLGLFGALFFIALRKIDPPQSILVTFSIYGMLLWLIRFIPDVHTYPLSLGWSETSRYYYASLFFSRQIYGKSVPLSSLHPTRYLMQAVPYLISNLPLWAHRLWQVILWLGVTFVGGIALSRRLKLHKWWAKLGVWAWFLMFCFQGPVYYHLMAVIIIVLLSFNKDKLGRTLIFVGLASLWAGISRVNWFPVAGMLAATCYVLEVPKGEKNFWEYWRWPVFTAFFSFLLAFLSQSIYAMISGNPVEVFGSSFNSPLYAYRLFPNEAYGPGIINLMITATFPLWVIILWLLYKRIRTWYWLRLTALLVILLALLGVGLIVSMKIGGGDNLHNMDAFLVFLAVITAMMAFNRFEPDTPELNKGWILPLSSIVLAFFIPIVFVLDTLHPYPKLDTKRAWEDIQTVQRLIDEVMIDGGEVLFIQHRHLLTFDSIEGAELVPEYEKVFLMEMAMSENEAYLSKFWADMASQRFDLIITEPLSQALQTSEHVFGEENNVWLINVQQPMLAYYVPLMAFEESTMILLEPRTD